MKQDEIEELKELIAFLKENEIAEFDLDRGDFKVRLKFASAIVAPVAASQGVDMATLAHLLASHNAPAQSAVGHAHCEVADCRDFLRVAFAGFIRPSFPMATGSKRAR
jgi:hypothetical protein